MPTDKMINTGIMLDAFSDFALAEWSRQFQARHPRGWTVPASRSLLVRAAIRVVSRGLREDHSRMSTWMADAIRDDGCPPHEQAHRTRARAERQWAADRAREARRRTDSDPTEEHQQALEQALAAYEEATAEAVRVIR